MIGLPDDLWDLFACDGGPAVGWCVAEVAGVCVLPGVALLVAVLAEYLTGA